MRTDILEIDTAWGRTTPGPLQAMDADAVRLLLTGDSVIDWQRLSMESLTDVDNFLATHLLDPTDSTDRKRLRYVFNEAVSYLEEHLHLSFPKELRNPEDVRTVFLWASEHGGFRRKQILSCVIVKLMHVIHHMEAADLKFRLHLSEEQLLELAHDRILSAAREMMEEGLPVLSFYGNRKSRSSVITKLLAKPEEVAATIFDNLRYRIVVDQPEDLLPILRHMTRHLFPFNYVIPRESHNSLIDIADLVAQLQPTERDKLNPREVPKGLPRNVFSGNSYKTINWIVDYPIRVENQISGSFPFEHGRVVFVAVEFQLLDKAQALLNEKGENAHALYKERQHVVVASRLKRGASRKG